MCDENIQIYHRLTAELRVSNNPGKYRSLNKSCIPFFLRLLPLTFPPFLSCSPLRWQSVAFISLRMWWVDLVPQPAAHPAALTGRGGRMKKLVGRDGDGEITYPLLAWANQT